MKRTVLDDQVLMVQNYNQQGVIDCTTLNYLSYYFRYKARGSILRLERFGSVKSSYSCAVLLTWTGLTKSRRPCTSSM